jgi:A/G-specific adenine glycosylase
MLIAIREDGSVLLEKRPSSGIWGGLWCLPEFESDSAARSYAMNHLQDARLQPQPLEPFEHAFTHFDLMVAPLLAACSGEAGVMDAPPTVWYTPLQPAALGLPAPIRTLLERVASPTMFDRRAPG